jgi:hypothetical protein
MSRFIDDGVGLLVRPPGKQKLSVCEAHEFAGCQDPSCRPPTSGGTGGSHPTSGRTTGKGTKEKPLRTRDVDVAAKALAEGKYVQLDSKRTASTLLDDLSTKVQAARAAKKDPPNINLCLVSVPGTNLFCSETKGIPRIQMPQLSGTPTPGSKADGFPKDAEGGVNLGPAFVEHLRSKGIGVKRTKVDASVLKASQSELVGAKVAGIASAMEDGKIDPTAEPIFVTRDDYVVDGHHRWAATVAVELKGRPGKIAVNVIDNDIIPVLAEAFKFAEDMGIPPKAAKPDGFATRAMRQFHLHGRGLFHLQGKHDQKSHGRRGGRGPGSGSPEILSVVNKLGRSVRVPSIEELNSYDPVPGTSENEQLLLKWLDEDGNLLPERDAVHDALIAATLIDPKTGLLYPARPEGQREVLFMGGGAASGKTSALSLGAVDKPEGATTINPDDFKTALPETRGKSKDGKQGNGMRDKHPEEWAGIVHEESSLLAKRQQAAAVALGMNVVVDKTSADGPKTVRAMQEFKDAGYSVQAQFVTIDIDTAVSNALSRAKSSGRPVAEDVLRHTHEGANQTFLTVVAETDVPTTLVTTLPANPDGSFPPQVLTARSAGQGILRVVDRGAWDDYLTRVAEIPEGLTIKFDDDKALAASGGLSGRVVSSGGRRFQLAKGGTR